MLYALWKILVDFGPALMPVLAMILVLVARVLWNHETRIRELEKAKTRLGRSVYGDEDDNRQAGLSKDLKDVLERLDRLENKVDELNHEDD